VKSINNLAVFLSSKERWTFLEEVSLLRAVEQFGYGNWDSIAEFVKTRSISDCRSHFDQFYLSGSMWQYLIRELDIRKLSITNHTQSNEDSILLPPVLISENNKKLIGFLPLRDDYEREYKNDIERMLNNLVSSDVDERATKQDMNFKYSIINVYLGILRERQELKKHARQCGLLSFELAKLIDGNCNMLETVNSEVTTFTGNKQLALPKQSRKSIKRSKGHYSFKSTKQKIKDDIVPFARKKGRPRKIDADLSNLQTSSPSILLNAFSGDSLSVVLNSVNILNQGKRRHSVNNADGCSPRRKIARDSDASRTSSSRIRRLSNSKFSFPSNINYESLTDDEKKAIVDKYK
ncbi:hypothetical protein GJ496_003601, partial [Pomphorhynchus laevis]